MFKDQSDIKLEFEFDFNQTWKKKKAAINSIKTDQRLSLKYQFSPSPFFIIQLTSFKGRGFSYVGSCKADEGFTAKCWTTLEGLSELQCLKPETRGVD